MIYPTSTDTDACARDLDDKLLDRAVQYSAEVVCTILKKKKKYEVPYDSIKGPWVEWASDRDNFRWVLSYHRSCADEFKRRMGRAHRAWRDCGAEYFDAIPRATLVDNVPRLDFDREIGVDYTWLTDPFLGYRLLLNSLWLNSTPEWNERYEFPVWYKNRGSCDYLFTRDDHPSWWTDSFGIKLLTQYMLAQVRHLQPGTKATTQCPRCGEELRYRIDSDTKAHIRCERSGSPGLILPKTCINWQSV